MKTNTLTRLIEVATPLFASKGFAGVSVREITDAAAVNVSAVSYYFNGKEGLYQAVLEEQFAPLQDAWQAGETNTSLSPVERLESYADHIAKLHLKRPSLARLMGNELNNPTKYGRLVIEKNLGHGYKYLHTLLKSGIESGDFRPDLNIAYATISLAGILNFFFLTKPIIQKITQLPEDANSTYPLHAFRIYLKGIAAQKENMH